MSAQTADDDASPSPSRRSSTSTPGKPRWPSCATREKAATRELDAIAAARRRLPMVELPDYVLEGADGPVRLADVFEGKRQLIVYNHMWFPGEDMAVPGLHRVHQPVHPAGVPGQLRRPLRHRHPGSDRRGARLQGAGGQQDDVVLHGQQPLRHRHGRTARRWLPGERLPPHRRHRVPDLQHPGPWHRAAQPQLRPDRPAALRTPGGVAGLAATAGRSRPPTAVGPHRRPSRNTPNTHDPSLSAAAQDRRPLGATVSTMYPGAHARDHPDQPALIMATSGEVVTFSQLEDRANRLAQFFRAVGLTRLDHVAFLMENNPRLLECNAAARALRSVLHLHQLVPLGRRGRVHHQRLRRPES